MGHTVVVDIREHFDEVSRLLGVGPVSVSFYPYAELKHTWVSGTDGTSFKISDYLVGAPDEVSRALAWYLVCRAYGRRCPEGKADGYTRYSRSKALWEPNRSRYLGRARGLSFQPRGEHRDLEGVTDYVNSYYFARKLDPPTLAWSCESPRRRLGFYFESLNLLAANRVLDSEKIPRYVLEFVVYHELLHHRNAGDGSRIVRVHHTKDFREQERAFNHFEDAERWLRRIVARYRRCSRGR